MKLGVIILSFTILFQSFNFEVNDIFKFSTLIDHILNHIEEGDNIDDFLDLHYGDKTISHQNEHKEHKELPFKQHHIDFNIQYISMPFEENNLISIIELNTIKNNFSYKDPFTNSYINIFFQPPRK